MVERDIKGARDSLGAMARHLQLDLISDLGWIECSLASPVPLANTISQHNRARCERANANTAPHRADAIPERGVCPHPHPTPCEAPVALAEGPRYVQAQQSRLLSFLGIVAAQQLHPPSLSGFCGLTFTSIAAMLGQHQRLPASLPSRAMDRVTYCSQPLAALPPPSQATPAQSS